MVDDLGLASDPAAGVGPGDVDDLNLVALLELATDVAGQAGALLLDGMRRRRLDVDTKSTATDLVTDMDRAAEELIVGTLRQARPHDGILAEEGSGVEGTNGIRWVIDPLDGTTNYFYGHPTYSVSIALEVDGEPVVGVVADPGLEETFTAARGLGAHLNGEPIGVSDAVDLPTSLIATGFGYDAARRRRQAEVLVRVIPEVRDVRRRGVASLDLCWVACGRLDGYYEVGLQPWDVAAGMIIATEAGAQLTNLVGGDPLPSSVMAAAPGIAGALLELLRRVDASSV